MSYISKKIIQIKNIVKDLIQENLKSSTIPKDMRFSHKPLRYYKTPIGKYYLPANAPNDYIAIEMRHGRYFEPEVIEVGRKYIKKGTAALDVGANFGQMSILFSELVGDEGQVFSFEADDYVHYILQKNISANRCDNIRAFLRAVYDKSNEIMFFPVQDFKRYAAYGSYGLDPKATSGRMVTTLAIDDLNIQLPISFMKVDVQGSDLFAMRGAIQTIKKHQMPIIFEFEQQFQADFKTTFQDYLDFISSISYKVETVINNINYVIVPDRRKVIGQPGIALNQTDAAPNVAANTINSKIPGAHGASSQMSLCKFLKSRAEVDECSEFLRRNGYVSHRITCKDWDLAHIIPEIGDGNFLDMGSSESYILKNVVLKGIRGEKCGIDLREPDVPVKGVRYIVGDLTDTKFPDKYFRHITCLSVIEHEVDFAKFASETARLLEDQGKLFVTFDYWNPKVTPPIKMYDLNWQPLDEQTLKKFIAECEHKGLYLVADMDWTLGEAVIRHGYYSPHPSISYTFGLVVFEKR